ncbi:MAG: hypothetical protein OEY52_16625 [Gammaproteobacteria bacterium]|nr:hypothetical protein [Gammaproteobacteria bacterium]
MVRHNRGCLGEYDFDNIASHARKRFVEGIDTVSLMSQARTETEREEIALVCLLSVEDQVVRDIQLSCHYSDTCKMTNCRDILRNMINDEIANKSE